MNLKWSDVEEFREVWEGEFGQRLSDGEARHQAARVLNLFMLLARTHPRNGREPEDNAPLGGI